jgi:hypothetical protein
VGQQVLINYRNLLSLEASIRLAVSFDVIKGKTNDN